MWCGLGYKRTAECHTRLGVADLKRCFPTIEAQGAMDEAFILRGANLDDGVRRVRTGECKGGPRGGGSMFDEMCERRRIVSPGLSGDIQRTVS